MIEIKKDDWWPTPIWCFDIDPTQIDFDKVKDEIYRVKKVDEGRTISNYGGWQSNKLNLNQNTEMNKLMHNIEEVASHCFDDIGAGENVSRNITDYWININKKHNFNIPHNHPLSFLSGVVYIESNKDSGNILFHRNSAEDYYYLELTANKKGSENNSYGFSYIYYPCTKYKVILFPSYLSHSVEGNKSESDRISISFNFGKN